MRELAKENENKRAIAKKEKSEPKKLVAEGKQRVVYKNGKKIIHPVKMSEQPAGATGGEPMDEEKPAQEKMSEEIPNNSSPTN